MERSTGPRPTVQALLTYRGVGAALLLSFYVRVNMRENELIS